MISTECDEIVLTVYIQQTKHQCVLFKIESILNFFAMTNTKELCDSNKMKDKNYMIWVKLFLNNYIGIVVIQVPMGQPLQILLIMVGGG